jgi:hypothetical protein
MVVARNEHAFANELLDGDHDAMVNDFLLRALPPTAQTTHLDFPFAKIIRFLDTISSTLGKLLNLEMLSVLGIALRIQKLCPDKSADTVRRRDVVMFPQAMFYGTTKCRDPRPPINPI